MGSVDGTPGSPRSTPHRSLRAVYTSPCDSVFTYTRVLKYISNPTPKERTARLSALRQAVTHLQERINLELTRRMEMEQKLENGADVMEGHDDTDGCEYDFDEDEDVCQINSHITLDGSMENGHQNNNVTTIGDSVRHTVEDFP